MKTKEQIRAETKLIPRPANYKYGEKLKEWDATLSPGTEDLLARCEPFNDRIIVRLLDEPERGITLTDPAPLIGGKCREALVLKCGPGKWSPRGHRKPLTVKPGMVVWIGNWVDLEADGLALCQEGDVRVWQH